MYDIIMLIGTAGIGKTSTGRVLEKELNVPYINYGWLRQFYKDINWENDSKEEKYAIEQLKEMLGKHIALGYENTIVDDLPLFRPNRVVDLAEYFKDRKYLIVSLVVNNDDVLKQRVLDESRDSVFRDVEKAIKWNKGLQESELLPNEHRIDTTNMKVVEEISNLLSSMF